MQTGYDFAEKATCSKIQYNNRRKRQNRCKSNTRRLISLAWYIEFNKKWRC